MAAWLVGLDTLKIQRFTLGPHDVRVRMKAVGICGSDVHCLKTLRYALFMVKEPIVNGHESAGIVEEVGSEVRTLVPVDRVALGPGIRRHNLCPDMEFFATPLVHGSLANQPSSVGVHACRRANVGPETNVLVMGAGPIGLVTMLAACASGVPRIVIVDVDDHRLSVAKYLAADDIMKVSTDMKDVSKEVALIQKLKATEIDMSFDCAGFNKTMSTALTATRSDCKVCLVNVIGIWYKNTWPLCKNRIAARNFHHAVKCLGW
ncbi:hypothetical protein ACJRO7_006114 [Eucalyptus globulus]|uniref:Sorbitol dehydrogenase n=1 Tax=Eucalyptus globulus TaxID=34317 RepID=A0ABD3IIB1_EUCGL